MSTTVPPVDLAELFSNPAILKDLAEFLQQRAATSRCNFRDIWLKYQEYGTSRTDGGRMRIKSWNSGQRPAAKPLLTFFGDLAWDACTLGKVEEYRVWRGTVPKRQPGARGIKFVGAATRNRELHCAAAAMSFGVKRGLISRNPMAGLSDEPMHHERDFAVPREDVERILAKTPAWLRQFLLVLYGTGMRRGECLSLEWADINLDAGFISLRSHKTKSGKAREIPMSTNVRVIFDMLPREGNNPWVWMSRHEAGQHINEWTLSYNWRRARDSAGVVGPKGQSVWLHSLRHTFATDMIVAGMPLELVMNICGWSGPAMAHRYINIARRHRETARAMLDARDAEGPSMLGSGARPKRAPVQVAEAEVAEESA